MALDPRERREENVIELCCALARQCYINEYAFDLTADENNRAHSLRDRIISALGQNSAVTPIEVAMLAAYMQLDCLPQGTLLKRSWNTLTGTTARAKPHRRRQLLPKARRANRGGPAIVPVPFFWRRMPAFGAKAEIAERFANVRFDPKSGVDLAGIPHHLWNSDFNGLTKATCYG